MEGVSIFEVHWDYVKAVNSLSNHPSWHWITFQNLANLLDSKKCTGLGAFIWEASKPSTQHYGKNLALFSKVIQWVASQFTYSILNVLCPKIIVLVVRILWRDLSKLRNGFRLQRNWFPSFRERILNCTPKSIGKTWVVVQKTRHLRWAAGIECTRDNTDCVALPMEYQSEPIRSSTAKVQDSYPAFQGSVG